MDLIHLATHVGHACDKGENGPIVICCMPTIIVAELLLMEMHNELFLLPVKHSLGR
jgi:hypothetical protein